MKPVIYFLKNIGNFLTTVFHMLYNTSKQYEELIALRDTSIQVTGFRVDFTFFAEVCPFSYAETIVKENFCESIRTIM